MKVEKFGFAELARDLERAERDIVPEVKKVTSKTLLGIKKGAARIMRGHPHFPMITRTYSYDITVTKTDVIGEVGADIEKTVGGGPVREPGSLDFILEYGALNTAPIPHWRPAAEKEVPLWEKYLGDAAEGLLDDHR